MFRKIALVVVAAALLAPLALKAQETAVTSAVNSAIRKLLAERLPKLPPIDEISKTPMPGVYEVRYGGTEIMYSDEKGEFVIVNGAMVDTKTRADLTEARLNKLTALDFSALPLKDAITIRQGSGSRKMAVFVDPNCGYCKHFERDLAAIKDVTIYTFLLPILGADSVVKSKDIWCAKDAAVGWRAWMLNGVLPSKAALRCDTDAIDRNLAFGRKHRINGTPAVFFVDGTRKPGAIPGEQVEKLLASAVVPTRK